MLTLADMENAMQEWATIQPYAVPKWFGPKWATDLLAVHWPDCLQGDHTATCDDCTKAWRVMSR